MAVGQLITALGFCVLLHATLAVSKYRDVLKFTQQEYSGLPQNLQLEVLLGTVLCLIGGFAIAGKLKPIVLSRGAPSMDANSYRPDFVSFNHRGRAFPHQIPTVY